MMITTSVDLKFEELFAQLNKTDFMAATLPAFGRKPTPTAVRKLVSSGGVGLPAKFRTGYANPLATHLEGLFAQVSTRQGIDTLTLEAFTGAVYQHTDAGLEPDLHRFLAVISNMFRSFLDKTKRAHLDIPLKETLPPLAVFQSDPSNGPFTITVEQIEQIINGDVGVVSLPRTFSDHPLLYGSLAHETGGHDVVHADPTLLPQLRAKVYSLFDDTDTRWLGLLWDYWMDEAVADAYGVLNIGPSFGYNLALLLAVFIGQSERPRAKQPRLRTSSGADDTGALDVHPTDLLRLSLIQGVVESMTNLSSSSRDAYVERLSRLAHSLAPGASTVELTGFARVTNGKAMNFQESERLDIMQEAARKVGVMIATTSFDALAGHSVQDIETWDDSDENSATVIAGRLNSGSSIIGAGDDAQIVAGLTLAAIQQPSRYAQASKLANDALNDSYRSDPYWGSGVRDLMLTRPTRTARNPEVSVDPYAAEIIDFNPLEPTTFTSLADSAAMVTRHQIAPIPWPTGAAPEIDRTFTFKGPTAELPQADFVIFTWTSAEANAMSAVMTPNIWAMPPSKYVGLQWHEYTNQWDAKYRGRSTGRAPAASNHYIGKYMPIKIGTRKVLLFKSNFHLARDDKSMPVKDMFKQVIQQSGAHLAITSGTAGAIGPKLLLGDVMVANAARFKCDGTFAHAPFNGKTYKSTYTLSQDRHLKIVNDKLVKPNADRLMSPRKRLPFVFTPSTATKTGEPPVIVTTDKFEFDDKQNTFHLQGLGAMVEMDDAVLGLACQELGGSTQWLAIRNASDPQMPSASPGKSSDIYKEFGYWTSIPSALACWAAVMDYA
jgi:nucleoside phosphorylase